MRWLSSCETPVSTSCSRVDGYGRQFLPSRAAASRRGDPRSDRPDRTRGVVTADGALHEPALPTAAAWAGGPPVCRLSPGIRNLFSWDPSIDNQLSTPIAEDQANRLMWSLARLCDGSRRRADRGSHKGCDQRMQAAIPQTIRLPAVAVGISARPRRRADRLAGFMAPRLRENGKILRVRGRPAAGRRMRRKNTDCRCSDFGGLVRAAVTCADAAAGAEHERVRRFTS